jgi:hypothetical protein
VGQQMTKLYLSSEVIDIKLLRELKQKFDVVFEYNRDIELSYDNGILTYKDDEIDISKMIREDFPVSSVIQMVVDSLKNW